MHAKTNCLALALLLGSSVSAYAGEKSAFADVKEHLYSGHRTTSILEIGKCEQKTEGARHASGIVGGFVIPAFLDIGGPEEKIVYSDKHFTVRKDGVAALEFMRYTLSPDEKAKVDISVLSAKTYEPLDSPKTYECKLGEGLRFAYE